MAEGLAVVWVAADLEVLGAAGVLVAFSVAEERFLREACLCL